MVHEQNPKGQDHLDKTPVRSVNSGLDLTALR